MDYDSGTFSPHLTCPCNPLTDRPKSKM